ncbi:MAG: type II secretion system F family protein [bacterium]|nr:type II secretion system F family protein [bacterium]
MQQFLYEARDRDGKFSKGSVDAYSEEQAVTALQERGLTILMLASAREDFLKADISVYFSKPNRKDVVVFTRQLSTIIGADIPLIEGLETIAIQSEKPAFAKVVREMTDSIRGGSSLSASVAKTPKLFGDFYVSLVKSGEVSGRLEQTLLYLADYLERSQNLNAKIRGAMTYPLFIVSALGIVGTLMMTTVLPKLLGILTESGVEDIPFVTRALIFVTNFVTNYIFFILVLLGFLFWFFSRYLKTESGRYQWDRLKISFPKIGQITRNIYLARISETLSTLIKSGVPILEAIKITSEIAGNYIFRDILMEARENVRNGGSISAVLMKYQEVPRLVSAMLAIGEKTGKTDFMLDNIYKFYGTEADRDIQNLSTLIEPVLLLLLGLGAGILVAGILLPIFSLVGAG